MGNPSPIMIRLKLGEYFTPGKVKTAISLPDLVSQTNSFSIKNRPGCVPSLLKSSPKDLFLDYNVKCNLKDSDPSGHDVKIRFDTSQVTDETTAKNLDVAVSCSCVAPGTRVRMADGTEKSIETVRAGDLVFTHKGRARRVTAALSRTANPGEKGWECRSEGYRDPLIVSDDHPLGAVRGHQLCACGCGEPLPLSYKGVTFSGRWERKWIKGHSRRGEARPDRLSEGEFGWIKPFALIKAERLYFPRFEWAGSIAVDPDLASLAGYYAAEGSLTYREKKLSRWGHEQDCPKSVLASIDGREVRLYTVTFTLNQNESATIAEDIKDKALRYCGPDTEIRTKFSQHGNDKWMTVEVKSPSLAARMLSLIGIGSLNKKLSSEVLSWNREAMLAFVSSYCLGDGYLGDVEQSVFSNSRDMLMQVSAFLFSEGVWHGYTWQKHKNSPNTSHRLNWNYRRHPQIFEAIAPRMRSKDFFRASQRIERKECQGDSLHREWGLGFLRALRSKRSVSAPSTWFDLEVEEDESFIANGVVVHNCPAFLYWGMQWNAYQRDALEGEPRPLLTAPTERLDLRDGATICKHVKAVSERILPSVQHNIVKILRQRKVDEAEKEEKRFRLKPTLEDRQREMRERQLKKRQQRPPAQKIDVRKQLEEGLARRDAPAYDIVQRDTPATPEERERVPVLAPEPVQPKSEPLPPEPALTPIPELEEDTPAPPPVKAPPPQKTPTAPSVKDRMQADRLTQENLRKSQREEQRRLDRETQRRLRSNPEKKRR